MKIFGKKIPESSKKQSSPRTVYFLFYFSFFFEIKILLIYIWLCCVGLVAPQHEGSSRIGDWTPVSFTGRWIFIHWATSEALYHLLKRSFFPYWIVLILFKKSIDHKWSVLDFQFYSIDLYIFTYNSTTLCDYCKFAACLEITKCEFTKFGFFPSRLFWLL